MRLTVLLVLMLTIAPALAATAPRMAVKTLAEVPVVTRAPYDERADADAAVNAAFARAAQNHKRVLIDLGGNWCPDCLVLANVMRLPALDAFLKAHYEVVAVDVGRFDRNLQIPARFGITKRLAGVPAILIATPDGRLVNRNDNFALANARTMTPQGLADWLAKWSD